MKGTIIELSTLPGVPDYITAGNNPAVGFTGKFAHTILIREAS